MQQKPKRDGAGFLPLLQPTDRQCDALDEGGLLVSGKGCVKEEFHLEAGS